MCGRVVQSSGPLRYAIVDGMNVRDSRVSNYPPRWNGAPSQESPRYPAHQVSLDPLRWDKLTRFDELAPLGPPLFDLQACLREHGNQVASQPLLDPQHVTKSLPAVNILGKPVLCRLADRLEADQ